MTTEFGLEKLHASRAYIETLRGRRDYLLERMAEIEAERGHSQENTYRGQEVRAIEWALPILEAAWDTLARLRREIVDPAENRVRSMEGRERALAEVARR